MTESSLYDGVDSVRLFCMGGRWGMGSATPFSYLTCEPFGGAGQSFPQLDLGLPSKPGLGECDIGLTLRRIVLGQGLVDDLRRRVGDLDHELGQLPHGELVGVADVD